MLHTITALEVQQTNHERISVYLDGEFECGVPLLEAARLQVGQVLSDEDVTRLHDQDTLAQAVDLAVKLLARRPHSTAELRRYLVKKSFEDSVIADVFAKLEALGYVNDQAFAEYWVEQRDQFRPRGPRALRFELRQKGVPSSIIDSVLQPLDTHDAAYRAAQEKTRRLRGITTTEFRNKLGVFLVQRGFDYEIARAVVDEWIAELKETQPDYFAPHHTSEE